MRTYNFVTIIIVSIAFLSCFCPDDGDYGQVKVVFDSLEQDERIIAIAKEFNNSIDTFELVNYEVEGRFESYLYPYWDSVTIYKEQNPQDFNVITNIIEGSKGKCNHLHFIESFMLNGTTIFGDEANLTE